MRSEPCGGADRVRGDLPRLDGEFRIVAVAVMRVDEPHLVLPGREQDVAFVALADLAVAVKDLERDARRDRQESGGDFVARNRALARLHAHGPAKGSRLAFEDERVAAGREVLDGQRRKPGLATVEYARAPSGTDSTRNSPDPPASDGESSTTSGAAVAAGAGVAAVAGDDVPLRKPNASPPTRAMTPTTAAAIIQGLRFVSS